MHNHLDISSTGRSQFINLLFLLLNVYDFSTLTITRDKANNIREDLLRLGRLVFGYLYFLWLNHFWLGLNYLILLLANFLRFGLNNTFLLCSENRFSIEIKEPFSFGYSVHVALTVNVYTRTKYTPQQHTNQILIGLFIKYRSRHSLYRCFRFRLGLVVRTGFVTN